MKFLRKTENDIIHQILFCINVCDYVLLLARTSSFMDVNEKLSLMGSKRMMLQRSNLSK